MAIPLDKQVAQRVSAGGGDTNRMMQTFRRKGDVLDLIALEQVVAQQKELNADRMKEQGIDPTTIYDKKLSEALSMVQGKNPDEGRNINEVSARTKDTLNQQQNIANAKAQQAGITQPTRMGSAGGLMKLASGGIVGFAAGGGVTPEEIEAYKKKNPNEPFDDATIRTIIANMPSSLRNKLVPTTATPYTPDPTTHISRQIAAGKVSEDPLAQMNPKQVQKNIAEDRKRPPPLTPKVDVPDPNAPSASAGLPSLNAEDFTLGKDTGRNIMLEGGVGEAARKGLEVDPETRAGERRTQTADSMGRAEGIEALGKQLGERKTLTDKLYTDEQRALDKKRDFVIGASGRASTVGGGVAAAMKAGEAARSAQQMKNLDDIQALERLGMEFKRDTGEKMEASYDKTLDTYYDNRNASMDALQSANAQELANARTNAQIESNIAIQNGTTLNKDLDRKATAAWRQLDRDAQALKDKNVTLEKVLHNSQTSLREMDADLQTAYTNAELVDKELEAIQSEIGDTPTPEQRQRLNLRRHAIRNEVNAKLSMRPSPDTPSFLETMDKLAKRVEEYGGRLEGSLDTIDVDLGKYG
jgi:hypothetical protein